MKGGRTPLHVTIETGRIEISQLFIKNGAAEPLGADWTRIMKVAYLRRRAEAILSFLKAGAISQHDSSAPSNLLFCLLLPKSCRRVGANSALSLLNTDMTKAIARVYMRCFCNLEGDRKDGSYFFTGETKSEDLEDFGAWEEEPFGLLLESG